MSKHEVLKAIADIDAALATEARQIERERLLERRACLRMGLRRIETHDRAVRQQ